MTGFTDRGGVDAGNPADIIKVVCVRLDDTRVKSLLVCSLDRRVTAWLPRSEITVEEGMRDQVRIAMPRWLARREGLSTETDERQGEAGVMLEAAYKAAWPIAQFARAKLDDRLDGRIRERHERGERPSDIGGALGLSVATVRERLDAMALEPHGYAIGEVPEYRVHPMWSLAGDDLRAAIWLRQVHGAAATRRAGA